MFNGASSSLFYDLFLFSIQDVKVVFATVGVGAAIVTVIFEEGKPMKSGNFQKKEIFKSLLKGLGDPCCMGHM